MMLGEGKTLPVVLGQVGKVGSRFVAPIIESSEVPRRTEFLGWAQIILRSPGFRDEAPVGVAVAPKPPSDGWMCAECPEDFVEIKRIL